MSIFTTIFRKGSRTYFYSSLLFPREVRHDVGILYSYVRTADDYVDRSKPQKNEFLQFKKKTLVALDGHLTHNPIIDAYAKLSRQKKFSPLWTRAFLHSMEQDLHKTSYPTMKDLEHYMYGSAEVVGLMMNRLMAGSNEAAYYAQMLGKAMQYINFIRDIQEDWALFGRIYIPQEEIQLYKLPSLSLADTCRYPLRFHNFIRGQLTYFYAWLAEAKNGFHYLTLNNRSAVLAACKIFEWTADTIMRDPYIIYERKVRPSVPRIVKTLVETKLFL